MSEMNPNQAPQTKKKSNWLQWAMVLLFVIIGGFFGMLMVRTMEAASLNGASDGKVMLLWAILMVGMYVILFAHIVVHEAGHLIFGLLTGYKFVSFRIGSLMLVKNQQGYRVRRLRLGGTGGQCLLDPPEIVDGKMPNVLYNLGGCLMNLLVSIISLVIALMCQEGTAAHALLILSGAVGLIYALINGLPLPGEMANDGRNALDLNKDPEALTAFRTQLVLNKLNSEGVRLKDMPHEYFVWPSEEARSNVLVAAIAVFCTNRLLDEHRFEECAARLDELLGGDLNRLPGMYRKLLLNDRIYLHLLDGECETAVSLMDKEQKQFMKTMKGQLPIHRTEYAFALLGEKDAAKADKHLKEFCKVEKNYPHQAEIDSERELIALAQEKAAGEREEAALPG